MTKPKEPWIDLTEDINVSLDKIKVGMVLTFDFEGSKTSFKVMKMSKGAKRTVWAKEIKLFTEQDFEEKVGEIKPEDWKRKS